MTPEADPLGPMLAKFEVKVKAGAQFFQTQAIYHPEQFASFMKAVRPFKVKCWRAFSSSGTPRWRSS